MKSLYKNNFLSFLAVHFFVWAGIPSLRKSIPLDSVEAIMWGRYCDWGTNKHPPLSGFFADWFYSLFGQHAIGIYVLNQILVLIGFVYLYKLAKCFLSEGKSVLAVMLLEGVIYYGFSAQEYNVNVVSLALWPLSVFYFYQALQHNKMSSWVLTGIFAGLNMLNKYVGGVQLLCMALYLLFTKFGRSQFKKAGPYVTFVVFLAVVAPHVWWLYQYDFYPFEYLLGRAESETGGAVAKIWAHIFFPLKFLGSQILFSLLALAVYFLNYRRGEKEASNISLENKQFLKYLGAYPVLVFAFIAFVSGSKLKSMWGFPTLYMLGILLFAFYPFVLNDRLFKRMVKSVYVVMFLLASAAVTIIFCNKSEKINFPQGKFAEDMAYAWKLHTDKPLKYVGGEIWYAANLSLYAEGNPKPVPGMKPEYSPWFDKKDILSSGALVIYPDRSSYEALRNIYHNMSEASEYKLEFKNRIGKLKSRTIYYGFFEPEAEVKDE